MSQTRCSERAATRLAIGHATRTHLVNPLVNPLVNQITFNLPEGNAKGQQANNLQPWPKATLREQPSTFNIQPNNLPYTESPWANNQITLAKRPRYANNLIKPSPFPC